LVLIMLAMEFWTDLKCLTQKHSNAIDLHCEHDQNSRKMKNQIKKNSNQVQSKPIIQIINMTLQKTIKSMKRKGGRIT
jgi:hypothetical protein